MVTLVVRLDQQTSDNSDSIGYIVIHFNLTILHACIYQITGFLSTASTVVVGYYFEYNDNYAPVGLCFNVEYPALRRACTLDLTAGVMGILTGSLLLITELVSAYINQRDVSVPVQYM